MRLALRGANPLEWLALRSGLVPVPAAEAWGGMATSGVLVAAVRSGVTARLAQGPATADEIAAGLGLAPVPTRLLLDCLRSSGHVTIRSGGYALTRAARRWLDPASKLSIANFVAATGDYLPWWQSLEDVTRTGEPVNHHDAPPGDPYWRRYILGQLDLARLSAPEIARRLRIPPGARTVLDLGGGHGHYSAELCRRHPGLQATVLDLPGSTAIGRELTPQVEFRDGDVRTAELGKNVDAVLCFNLIHHLGPDEIVALFARVHEALAPGGTFAILDAFADPKPRKSAAANYLGMFMYLTSGSQVHTPGQLHEWLRGAGFPAPRRVPVLRIPGLALYQAGMTG